MPEPSPVAQAIRDHFLADAAISFEHGLAAALEALADQVVPRVEIAPQRDLESRREAMEWGMRQQTQITRNEILRIAAKLQGDND